MEMHLVATKLFHIQSVSSESEGIITPFPVDFNVKNFTLKS